MAWLRSVLPWLVAAVLLYLLFRRYSLAEVLEAGQQVNLPVYIAYLLVYFPLFCLLDIWGLHKILARFGTRGSFKQVAKLRLASNLAMILNYGVGQGVLAYLIRQTFEESFLRISSVLVVIIITDLYLAFSIAFVGTFLTSTEVGGYDLAPIARLIWAGMTISLTLLIILWRSDRGGALMDRLRAARIFHALNIARPGDYLVVLLQRLPFILLSTLNLYFLVMCFGAHIPLEKVIALVPLAMVVGAIPITPSGLGTEQFATIFLFQGFITAAVITAGTVTPPELLLAISLTFVFSMYLLKLFSGALCFPTEALKSGKTG